MQWKYSQPPNKQVRDNKKDAQTFVQDKERTKCRTVLWHSSPRILCANAKIRAPLSPLLETDYILQSSTDGLTHIHSLMHKTSHFL